MSSWPPAQQPPAGATPTVLAINWDPPTRAATSLHCHLRMVSSPWQQLQLKKWQQQEVCCKCDRGPTTATSYVPCWKETGQPGQCHNFAEQAVLASLTSKHQEDTEDTGFGLRWEAWTCISSTSKKRVSREEDPETDNTAMEIGPRITKRQNAPKMNSVQ
jgi:hypothetical protein